MTSHISLRVESTKKNPCFRRKSVTGTSSTYTVRYTILVYLKTAHHFYKCTRTRTVREFCSLSLVELSEYTVKSKRKAVFVQKYVTYRNTTTIFPIAEISGVLVKIRFYGI
jgi:hypothetical protein